MDTHGRAYTKALQQITTGVYLAELCLIGLMGISTGSSKASIGPLVITIILLIATIIFHILLNRAISCVRKEVASNFNPETHPEQFKEQTAIKSTSKHHTKPTGKIAEKNASFFINMLRIPFTPKFDNYLQYPMPEYSEEDRSEAYLNPSLTEPEPLLWIVHDNAGVSEMQKRDIIKNANLKITDEAAWWDEKGKMRTVWTDAENQDGENTLRKAPIYEKNVHY